MTEFTPQTSCADPFDPDTLTVSQAKQHILDSLSPLDIWEKKPIRQALGRILHQPVVSAINVPPHTNSAMDGYAINGDDIADDPFTVKQTGIAYAGAPFTNTVNKGECVRIMTGAMMPENCDTVIMQEHVNAEGNNISIHGKQKRGQHVRPAGEDIQSGETILNTGHKITPADLGLIASLGLTEVTVKRKLRVAFFSTGDELCPIGETLQTGQIYDSNRYTLYGMLHCLNVDILDMGIIPDEKDTLRHALLMASQQADVIITSGGVSVGDADYVKDMLDELGKVNFWKIRMKPGRPLAFGKINNAYFFGLPGNPVSVMVTFYQFVSPALRYLSGEQNTDPHTMRVNCISPIRKRPGRFEFQRGILFSNDLGEIQVKTTGEQGSGILRSMSIANCFILLDEETDAIQANTMVTVQPFSGLI